jgi:hypothetical protein
MIVQLLLLLLLKMMMMLMLIMMIVYGLTFISTVLSQYAGHFGQTPEYQYGITNKVGHRDVLDAPLSTHSNL